MEEEILRVPRTFCFIGELRDDKGVQEFLNLARATTVPWTLRVAGPNRLPDELMRALNGNSVCVEYPVVLPLSDKDLIRMVKESSAVLAPYTAPTTSGSLIMAATLGVPILALRSPAVGDLTPEQNIAPDIEHLAHLIDNFNVDADALAGFQSNISISEWVDSAANEWIEVLESASS